MGVHSVTGAEAASSREQYLNVENCEEGGGCVCRISRPEPLDPGSNPCTVIFADECVAGCRFAGRCPYPSTFYPFQPNSGGAERSKSAPMGNPTLDSANINLIREIYTTYGPADEGQRPMALPHSNTHRLSC